MPSGSFLWQQLDLAVQVSRQHLKRAPRRLCKPIGTSHNLSRQISDRDAFGLLKIDECKTLIPDRKNASLPSNFGVCRPA